MGEKAICDKPPEPSIFVNQESEARCLSALSCERFAARELFQDVDSLNQGNISLLQRIHRLDNILIAMEDKGPTEPSGDSFRSLHGSRRISSTPSSLEKRCKSTESVLEEVEEKGTLVERVSDLEKRVIKLHRMIATKSSENVAFPGIEIANFTRSASQPHDQAIFRLKEHEPSLQDVVDVEKHEVTAVSSAPSEHDHHHEPPFMYSEKLDISPQKKESPLPTEGHQGMVVSEGTSMEADDPRAHRQRSKTKSQRIKRWLLKKLHIGSTSTRQCMNF